MTQQFLKFAVLTFTFSTPLLAAPTCLIEPGSSNLSSKLGTSFAQKMSNMAMTALVNQHKNLGFITVTPETEILDPSGGLKKIQMVLPLDRSLMSAMPPQKIESGYLLKGSTDDVSIFISKSIIKNNIQAELTKVQTNGMSVFPSEGKEYWFTSPLKIDGTDQSVYSRRVFVAIGSTSTLDMSISAVVSKKCAQTPGVMKGFSDIVDHALISWSTEAPPDPKKVAEFFSEKNGFPSRDIFSTIRKDVKAHHKTNIEVVGTIADLPRLSNSKGGNRALNFKITNPEGLFMQVTYWISMNGKAEMPETTLTPAKVVSLRGQFTNYSKSDDKSGKYLGSLSIRPKFQK